MDDTDGLVQASYLTAALKKYNRKKRWRAISFWSAVLVVLGLVSILKASDLTWLVCFLAFCVAWLFEQQRKLIRAMQIRLAEMADVLDRIAGNEPAGHLLLELSEA